MNGHQTNVVALPPDHEPAGEPMSDDQHLLAYVRDRDLSCPLCGYNLRALTVPRCPECGKALKLNVGLVEPFLKAWVACAAATCLSAGVGVLLMLDLVLVGPPSFSRTGMIDFFSFTCMIPVALVVLLSRRWFLRQSRQRQTILAFLAIVAIVIQLALVPTWMN